MKPLKKIAAVLTALFVAGSLNAQTGQGTGSGSAKPGEKTEKTVEDIYLQSSVEVQVIRSLVSERGRSEKLKALEYIASMIEAGKVSDKSIDVISLLDELGSEGSTKEVRENNRLINDYPEVRRQAAELLGQVGGQKSKEILITMALKDKEPMVISEAVYSLGLLGGDDSGRVENIIASLVKSQDAVRPDNNFAYAAISALEMIGKKKTGQVRPDVFVALIQIAQGNYIRAVRSKALKVLDQFRKY